MHIKLPLAGFTLIAIFLFSPHTRAQEVNFKETYQRLEQLYLQGHYDSAIAQLEKVIPESEGSEEIDFQLLLIRSLIGNTEYRTAMINAQELFKKDSVTQDQKIQASILEMFSIVSTRIEYVGELKPSIDRLDSILRNSDNQEYLGYLNYIKARDVFRKGNYSRSFSLYDSALKIFPKDHPDILEILFWNINVGVYANKIQDPREKLKVAFNLIEESFPNHPIKAKLLSAKAYLNWRVGNYNKVLEIHENQFLPFIKGKEGKWVSSEVWQFLTNCILASRGIGNRYKTIKYTEEKINKGFEVVGEYSTPTANQYGQLAIQYHNLGDFPLRKFYLNKFQKVYDSLIRRYSGYEFNKLRQQGWINSNFGKMEDALKYYSEAIKKFPNYYDRNAIVNLHLSKAIVLNKIGKFSEAVKQTEDAIRILDAKSTSKDVDRNFQINRSYYVYLKNAAQHEKLSKVSSEIFKYLDLLQFKTASHLNFYFLNNHISYLVADNLLDSAESIAKQIFTEEKKIPPSHLRSYRLANTYNFSAYIQLKRFNQESTKDELELGYKYILEGVKHIDLLKGQTYNFANRQDILRRYLSIYKTAFKVCQKLYQLTSEKKYLQSAYQFAEEAKAQTLLEGLYKNQAIEQTQIPDTLLLQFNSLKYQDTFLKNKITSLEQKDSLNTRDSTSLIDFKITLSQNQIQYNELLEVLEEEYPNYREVSHNPHITTLPEVQSQLDPGKVVLEYFEGNEEDFVFVIQKDTAAIFKLEKTNPSEVQELLTQVQLETYEQQPDQNLKAFVNISSALRKKLIPKGAETLLENLQSLTIVPDGQLNYLPFELLVKQEDTINLPGFGALKYLVKDYNISYAYSTSTLFNENFQGSNREFNGKVLAVAPSYQNLLATERLQEKLGKFRDGFSDLLFNQEEVDNIGKFYPARTLIGPEANEKAFVEAIQDYDILHLAMHALIDNEDPMRSKLVFTQTNDSTAQDNYLHNFELYNMRINSKLAVLSACNSGYGDLEDGEGLMSLARAFTYAGAESVVMSHWRVADKTSSQLMDAFYQYLSEGKQKDEALRLAKLQYLESASPIYQHPFFWNNYVVFGNTSPLVLKPWYIKYGIWLLVLAALLAVSFIYASRRKSQSVL